MLVRIILRHKVEHEVEGRKQTRTEKKTSCILIFCCSVASLDRIEEVGLKRLLSKDFYSVEVCVVSIGSSFS